jgi:hypothetical protein
VAYARVVGVRLNDDSSIVLTVQVDGVEPGATVEISGYMTQGSRPVARFSEIRTLPAVTDLDHFVVLMVTAPATGLAEGEDITVITRVAEEWVTVLSTDQPGPSTEPGTAWELPSTEPGTVWELPPLRDTEAIPQPEGTTAASQPEETAAVPPPDGSKRVWNFIKVSASRWGGQLPPAKV